ncbi:hypothetical protein QBC44DRAFT_242554 [Cladorrhinum sp. PSN332]|nr:hypothetical protein QBC44DRAFT_242554 [Cladorrhinum sp. PSN332]
MASAGGGTNNTTNSSPEGGQQPTGGHLIHGLIGLSSGGFSETLRNSIQDSIGRIVREKAPDSKDGQEHTHDEEEEEEEEKDKNSVLVNDSHRRPRPQNLLHLAPELLLLIISHTPFADILRLRQTCKFFHHLASPFTLRLIFGPEVIRQQLHNHCKTCLLYDPLGRRLLLSPGGGQTFCQPLSNQCHGCALRENDARIKIGRKVCLADHTTVWVCRWCGWPIAGNGSGNGMAAYGHEQWHRVCYRGYSDALIMFFVLGIVQFCFGVVGGALSWRYFRHAAMVFAPSVTSFLLLWICLGFIMFRGNRKRTYHWTFLLELIILGLWITPVYFISAEIARRPGEKVPRSTQAALAMFGLNILFRFFNLLGNVIILFRTDLTRRRRPDISIFKRGWYRVACIFVFWTYPQSLEQKVPPNYL